MKLPLNIINKDADIICVKLANSYPVPTAKEVYEVLNLLPDYHPVKCALGILTFQGLRPIEMCDLFWNDCFFMDQQNTAINLMRHYAYKPINRRLKNGKTKSTYKQLIKPMFSKWLSNQLIKYRELNGECYSGKVFPWTTADRLNKFMSQARKKNTKECPFLLDPNQYPVKGQAKTMYKFNLYALRRFSFTFHYWVTYNQDIVSLSKAFGHSKTETTMQHYVFPKESIGLTQEMINNKITIDEFIFNQSREQTNLNEWSDVEPCIPIRCPGQRCINDYTFIVSE